MKLFLLVKGHKDIAQAEIQALTNRPHIISNDIMIVNTTRSLIQRLAFTRAEYDVLFQCQKDDLLFKVSRYNWKRIYRKNFAINIIGGAPLTKGELATIIKEKTKGKIQLRDPTTDIKFFNINDTIYAVKLVDINQEDFNERKAHKLPKLHPSASHPRLARAMINLTGINKGTLLDPCCGAGGILIEAALMHLTPKGQDIDELMLNRARINLKHLKLKATLKRQDATKINKQINYLATDLPYARNTKTQDLNRLYLDFFKMLKINLKKRAVIGAPHNIDTKKLLKIAKLNLKNEFKFYIHKSLTRHIYVIEP